MQKCRFCLTICLVFVLTIATITSSRASFLPLEFNIMSDSHTMRAMTSDGSGTLLQKDVPRPTPEGRQLLVKVLASGLNRIDT